MDLVVLRDPLALSLRGPQAPDAAVVTCALVAAGLLGLVMGSFVCCWAWRSSNGEWVVRGRLHCTGCDHALEPRPPVPFFGWLLARGRRRCCSGRVSVRYPIAELACGLAFAGLTWSYGVGLQQVELCALVCVLLLVTLSALDGRGVPNDCIVAAGGIRAAYLGACLALGSAGIADAAYYVLSALVAGAALLAAMPACDRLVGHDAMDGGDVGLLAVAALCVGWQQWLLLVPVACMLGLQLAALAVIASPSNADETGASVASEPKVAIPFALAIAAACLLTLLVGEPVVRWYLGLS